MIDFSFIICSHKAPPILNTTLESILSQEMTSSAEIILVNNGFSVEKEKKIFSILNKRIAFKIIHESKPGLGFARRTGFLAAEGKYFILLDDDNSIDINFIKELIKIIEQFPSLGGVSPLVEPIWEVSPPLWLEDFGRLCLSYNASREFRPIYQFRYWPPEKARTCIRPPGGGMIISKDVAYFYLNNIKDQNRIALARQPDSLIGCEDEDIFSGVFELNLGVVFCDHLKVYHHIPRNRIKIIYLIRLNFQMLRSYGILESMKKRCSYIKRYSTALVEFFQSILSNLLDFIKNKQHPILFLLKAVRSFGLFCGRIA